MNRFQTLISSLTCAAKCWQEMDWLFCGHVVRRCRFTLSNPATLKAPATKRLKLKCDKPLSSFASKFNLRRYNVWMYIAQAW